MIKKIFSQHALHMALLLFILIIAVANRFFGLDRLSLWADELWVVMESSKGSLLDMFTFVLYHDNHPPGHYFFTRYWQLIFGDSDFTIRFPFAVAGVFLVYSTYRIGKEHYSIEVGLIAATLMSSAWQAIYYSQEARANILVAVATLWSLNYFYRLVFASQVNKTNLVGFWLTAALCCYLHYVGMVFVACLALVFFALLLLHRQKSLLVLGLKLFLPVLLLYSPWIPGMYYHLTHKPPGAWWGVPEGHYFYDNFAWLFWFGAKIYFMYQAAFIGLVLFFILHVVNSKKVNTALANLIDMPEPNFWSLVQFSSLLLLMTVLPPMVFFIKSKISQPAYDFRHFVFIMPFVAIAAGFLTSLFFIRFRHWIKNTILVLLVIYLLLIQNYANVIGKLYLGPHFKAEYRQSTAVVARDLELLPAPSIIIANATFFNHYLQRMLKGRTADYHLTTSQEVSALDDIIAMKNAQTIYFLETPETQERNMVSALDKELAKKYLPLCRTRFVYAQTIKFSTESTKDIDWDQLPNCD